MSTLNTKYFSKIIAFGNSYSDNGEANRISNKVMQNQSDNKDVYIKPGDDLYWKNRYSNGYTSVEVMAKMLNTDILNFATGGATSGFYNYTSWMDSLENTGVIGQIEKYKNSLENKQADPDALYYIFPFENDYFKFIDFNLDGTIEDICKIAIENLINGIEKLIVCGAKKFFIVSCSDLTLVPYENQMKRTNQSQEFVSYINDRLKNVLKELIDKHKIQLLLFKHTDLSDIILKTPEKFGFKKIKEACQVTYPESLHVKENPDEFYFWDEWHFSRATHKIFGKTMSEQVVSYKWK